MADASRRAGTQAALTVANLVGQGIASRRLRKASRWRLIKGLCLTDCRPNLIVSRPR